LVLHHRLHSQEVLVVSHLGSRTRLQLKVRAEGSPSARIQRQLRAQAAGFHSPKQSLRIIRSPLGFHLVNPQRTASLRLPPDSRLINRAQKRPTQRRLGSPLRHPNKSNTRRVLHSGRQYRILHARPHPQGFPLDNLSRSNRPAPLRSRLIPLQAARDLALHLPAPRLEYSRWRQRRRPHSNSQGPPVHRRSSLRQIRSGLVRGLCKPRLLLHSRVSRSTLREEGNRHQVDHSEQAHRRRQRRALAEMLFSQWVPLRRSQHHHPGPV